MSLNCLQQRIDFLFLSLAQSLRVLFGHFYIVLDVNSLFLVFNSSSSGWTEDSFEVGILRSFLLALLERLLLSRFTQATSILSFSLRLRSFRTFPPQQTILLLVEPKAQLDLFFLMQSLKLEIAYKLLLQFNRNEYEQLVKENLNTSIKPRHYHSSLSREISEHIVRLKIPLQQSLFDLITNEQSIRDILSIPPVKICRKGLQISSSMKSHLLRKYSTTFSEIFLQKQLQELIYTTCN